MFHILSKIHEECAYKPSVRDVRLWFAVINELVFNGKVPKFKYVTVKRIRGQLGACQAHQDDNVRWCELEIDENFQDFSTFLAVLAHEMIHCYQWTVLHREMGHGRYFWMWAKKFRRYHLKLLVRY